MARVCVWVPGSRRARGFSPAVALAWRDVVDDPGLVGRVCRAGDVVRVDSPGEDDVVWARLSGLPIADPTERRPGAAWFAGLRRVLTAIDAGLPPGVTRTHPAETVCAMTDKLGCAQALAAANVPIPPTEAAPPTVAALGARLEALGWSRAFVKPRWGSSGAGVCAVRHTRGRWLVTSPARLVAGRVVNHKRLLTTAQTEEVDRLLGPVLADGAVLQRWVPKATTSGGPFDLRVLVIDGRPRHRIARVGRGPITNLHLDSARQDAAETMAPYGGLDAVLDACTRAAAVYPAHHAVGVDVMVDAKGHPFVIELNAWGDLLPGLLHEGQTTLEAQGW